MVTGRIGSRSNDRDTWKIQSRDAFANDSATVHARPPWILHFFQLADWNMRVNGRSSNQRTFPEKFIEIDHSTQPATTYNTSFLISFQVIANNSGYSTIFLLIKLLASTRRQSIILKIFLNESRSEKDPGFVRWIFTDVYLKKEKIYIFSSRCSLTSSRKHMPFAAITSTKFTVRNPSSRTRYTRHESKPRF